MGSVTHIDMLQLKIFKTVGASSSAIWAGKCQNDPTKSKGEVKINCSKAKEEG